MITVDENEDGSFTISWDENDPKENILSNYTSEELTQIIIDYAKKTLEESRDSDDYEIREYEEVYEHFIDQTAEEVEQDIDTLKQFIEASDEDWESIHHSQE